MNKPLNTTDHTGIKERRLAWFTVGIPTLGTLVAIVLCITNGITILDLSLLTGMYLVTALGVEVGLHRFFSHRAFQANTAVTAFLAVTGSMAAQGPVLFWTATHRQHHAHSDQPNDPHSPCLHGSSLIGRLKGWWHAHIGWLFTLRRKNWSQYVPDLFRNRTIVRLNQGYYLWITLGIAIPTIIGGFVSGSFYGSFTGFLWGGLVRIFLVDHATWCINSIAHTFGTKSSATQDNSRNVFWLAIPTMGGGWHNNHHALPALAYTGIKWWQIDLGGRFIDLLAFLGWAWDIRKPAAEIKNCPSNPKSSSIELPEGISQLSPTGAKLKATVALVVMVVPFFGMIEAIRLSFHNQFTSLNVGLFTIFYFIQMFGVSMGFHRYMAHRTFKTSLLFQSLLLIAGSMAAQGPLLFWVATHRRHHLYSDQPGDPHSPNLSGSSRLQRLKGLWHAHMPWMLAPDMSSWSYFAKDILKERSLFYFHRTYPLWVILGLLLPGLIGGLLTKSWIGFWSGFIFGGLARLFVANQAAWAVGSVCHCIGKRPFVTGDHSTNNWVVATLTFGEGLQNNHHAFPSWYRHGVHWYEPDLTGWVLTFLGKLRIVWDLCVPPKKLIEKRCHVKAKL